METLIVSCVGHVDNLDLSFLNNIGWSIDNSRLSQIESFRPDQISTTIFAWPLAQHLITFCVHSLPPSANITHNTSQHALL